MIGTVSLLLSILTIVAIGIVSVVIVKRINDVKQQAHDDLTATSQAINVSMSNAAAYDATQQKQLDSVSASLSNMSTSIYTQSLYAANGVYIGSSNANVAYTYSNKAMFIKNSNVSMKYDANGTLSVGSIGTNNVVINKALKVNTSNAYASNWPTGIHAGNIYATQQLGVGSNGAVTAYMLSDGTVAAGRYLQIKGGKSDKNPQNFNTIFPDQDGVNRIRGNTQIDGNTSNMGNMSVANTLTASNINVSQSFTTSNFTTSSMKLADGGQFYAPGRMNLRGDEALHILNKQGAVVSKAAGGTGNLNVEGNLGVTSDINMKGGTIRSSGRLHVGGEELLYLLNKGGVSVSKAWGGNGDLNVEGNTTTQNIGVKGDVNMNGGTIRSSGRLHIGGEESLFLLNKGGVNVSKAWGGNGNLTVGGKLDLPNDGICVQGVCISPAQWKRLSTM